MDLNGTCLLSSPLTLSLFLQSVITRLPKDRGGGGERQFEKRFLIEEISTIFRYVEKWKTRYDN